ncbi:MAG: PH domain-containing protein [Bifidobacteriaceae bacterium]|nr:PH domain-containing protein [Bifidobacteriaceae bacterium]
MKSWAVIAALVGAVIFQLTDELDSIVEFAREVGWRWLVLGLFALLLMVFLLALASWWRTRWRIGPATLELAAGLVFRARRTVRLDRIEAVDVIRPLVPRLFGLVKLKIESAGGGDSAVELGYLKASDAERWRQVVLAAAAQARQAEDSSADGPGSGGPASGDGPAGGPGFGPAETEGASAASGEAALTGASATDRETGMGGTASGEGALAGASAGDGRAGAAAAASGSGRPHWSGGAGPDGAAPPSRAVGWSAGPPKSAETQIGELLGDSDAAAPELFAVPTKRVVVSLAVSPWTWLTVLTAVAGLVLVVAGVQSALATLPAVLGLGGVVWNRLVSDFGFSAKLTGRGLTLSHGLTTRVSQTVAPGRVVALGVHQGPIWRRFGWWRATMNVAGYGDDEQQTVLMPIGDADTVRRAVWAVAPELAQPGAWELVLGAMDGLGPTPGFTGAPRRARLFDPLAWRRTAFATTDEMVILRTGGLVREVAMVPHGRIQGIELHCGPFDRRRDLASVIIHSPDGPVSARVHHLARADALALVRGESERLGQSMSAALAARAGGGERTSGIEQVGGTRPSA